MGKQCEKFAKVMDCTEKTAEEACTIFEQWLRDEHPICPVIDKRVATPATPATPAANRAFTCCCIKGCMEEATYKIMDSSKFPICSKHFNLLPKKES